MNTTMRGPADSVPAPRSLADAIEFVGGTVNGLAEAEAARRLRLYGPNAIRADRGDHPIAIFAGQFRSPLIAILVAAAALSFALGEAGEGLTIGAIVLASSGLGFFQEFRASNAMAALRKRLSVTAEVLRDGKVITMPASGIVPGDVVQLTAGSLIPADGVLLQANDLHVDEAALTGESMPVEKSAADGDSPLGDNSSLHMGTSVRTGSARMMVLATGANTQFGAVAQAIGTLEPESDFARGVRRFGFLMTQIMLVIVAFILPVNLLLGRPILESLLFSAALAVGLTPELLPAVVAVTLSRGASALAKAGVLVRRLVAIENLGAMEILCTDKTGTITQAIVRLDRATDARGRPSGDTLKWALLNARLQSGMPNPLDDAIIEAGPAPAGYSKLDEVPYDFERKRLSVLVQGPETGLLICKGAVGTVLPNCTHVRRAGQIRLLNGRTRDAEERRLVGWSAEGYKVLAVATKDMGESTVAGRDDECSLILEGYLLFSDPIKDGVAGVVADLRHIGVRLKMITGDNRYAAAHIAAAAGISSNHLMTGTEVAGLSDRALARRVARVEVFAEVTPDHKERIVKALRRGGKVVGYLGDGINDAPALRAADVGISVDTALAAAKEAADVVLLDRDLGVLKDGIVIGRTAFANTLKYIAITTSANLGNMISMALASLFLPFLPMLAKQILLNNAMSDLPMLAISTDRVDPDVLTRPGKWDFPTLLRTMVTFGLLSSAFDGLTFAVLLLVVRAQEATFQTGWFLVSLLTELVIIGVMRTRRPALMSLPSLLLGTIAVLVAIAAIGLPYLPFAAALGFVPLPLTVQLLLGGIVIAYGITSELLKRRVANLRPRRHKSRGSAPPVPQVSAGSGT